VKFASPTVPGLERYAAQELKEYEFEIVDIVPEFVIYSAPEQFWKRRIPRGVMAIYEFLEMHRSISSFRLEEAKITVHSNAHPYRELRAMVEQELDSTNPNDRVIWATGEYILILRDLGLNALHARPYLKFRHPAALNPVLAHLMLRVAGWHGESIADPFCGSGTILIEAALHHGKITGFGVDIRKEYVAGARKNAAAAGVNIRFLRGDAQELHKYGESKYIITNPPYGLRMGNRKKIYTLYEKFAEELEEHFSGSILVVITPVSKLEHYFTVLDSLEIVHGKLKNKIWKLKI